MKVRPRHVHHLTTSEQLYRYVKNDHNQIDYAYEMQRNNSRTI